MKAVLAAFNQEKALVGAFSVITNLRMELFEALLDTAPCAEECERRLRALRATVTRQLEEVRRCREDKARLEQEAGRLRARADSDCMR